MSTMKQATYNLTGIAPMLQHNVQLSDPLSPVTKAMKEITSKKDKSDSDYEALSKLEWMGGLYTNKDGRIIVPSENIEAVVYEAAKKNKLGKSFASALYVEESSILEYDGPKDIEKLYAAGKNISKVSVKVQRNRVMRTRPMFPAWSLIFTVHYNSSIINEKMIDNAIQMAGTIIGLGDWRPKYGRFIVEK